MTKTITCEFVRQRCPEVYTVDCCSSCHTRFSDELLHFYPEETTINRRFLVCCSIGEALIDEGIVRS